MVRTWLPPTAAPNRTPICLRQRNPQALSWLLRRAVRRYASPVSEELEAGGFGDLPQRGVWAVSALARAEPGLSGRDLVARMGISKQAISQLDGDLGQPGICRPTSSCRRPATHALAPDAPRAWRGADHRCDGCRDGRGHGEHHWTRATARTPPRSGGVGRGIRGLRARFDVPTLNCGPSFGLSGRPVARGTEDPRCQRGSHPLQQLLPVI